MAGAANIHRGYPGHSTTSWFPYRVGGYAGFNAGALTIDVAPVPFDCIIRQVYLTVHEFVAAGTNLIIKTVDSTALTIVANISTVVTVANVIQTLHADVDGVEIVTGNGFVGTVTGDADSQIFAMWTLMLEATR